MKKMFFFLSFLVICFLGCASTYEAVGTKESIASGNEGVSFPAYNGEKTRIAVFPIAMTKKTAEDYPEYTAELKKEGVGFSLWNRICLYSGYSFYYYYTTSTQGLRGYDCWFFCDIQGPSTIIFSGIARFFD